MFVTDNILKDIGSKKTRKSKKSNEVIVEVDEDGFTGSDLDSKYSLIEEDSQNETRSTGGDVTQLFDKDMEMNESNFNLIKNSRVFKRSKNNTNGASKNSCDDFEHILDSDEQAHETINMKNRLSEEDNWFGNGYSKSSAYNRK